MTYKDAMLLGKECGLSLPAEFVNNIRLHACNLFAYAEIETELQELEATALEAGVRFSTVCGDAVLAGESTDRKCYVCRNLEAANEKASSDAAS